jgi:hypothetical protein
MSAMNIDRYRKQYEKELQKAAAPQRSTRPATAARAAPKSRAAAARANEIRSALVDEENLGPHVEDLLATLRDGKAPVAVRQAALQALGALDFMGPRFAPFRAEYKQALRELATDRRVSLRESALELLAIEKDPYAQEILVRGLERPAEAMVSDAKAMQFLGYDDHADLAPLARRVFKRATGAAREEALRMLANDPQSETLLRRVLTDKSENSSIRRLSASGLQSLNPAAFERAARRIVADDSDYDEIRATSLAALAHGREARSKPADAKFVETVQKLSGSTRSKALRSSSTRFLRSTEP